MAEEFVKRTVEGILNIIASEIFKTMVDGISNEIVWNFRRKFEKNYRKIFQKINPQNKILRIFYRKYPSCFQKKKLKSNKQQKNYRKNLNKCVAIC